MNMVREIDYGTPAAVSQTMVTLTIDGREVTVPEGTSIMRASMEAGIKVPKLCATDMLDSFGSCRLCLVEVEGRNGTPASCTTPVAPGLKVDRSRRPFAVDLDVLDQLTTGGTREAGHSTTTSLLRHRSPSQLM